jgi:DNA-3-methyladenine glycosylase
MHWCVNVVCRPEGTAAAALLRAGEVVEGVGLARERRGPRVSDARLAAGPANLARALGLDGDWHGDPVTRARGRLRVRSGTPVPDDEVAAGPRVGLTRGVGTPWRFWVAGNPHVSAHRRTGG